MEERQAAEAAELRRVKERLVRLREERRIRERDEELQAERRLQEQGVYYVSKINF